jgi:hypothetical protein
MSAEEEPSQAAGACVLVTLGGGATAVLFAISPDVGVLLVWLVGAIALRRSARRMSDSPATPPPRGATPSGDVYAGETGEVARVAHSPEGVMCILHPARKEATDP